MRKTENKGVFGVLSLVLGALFALGVELILLLLGSVAISAGVLRSNSAPQLTVAACLIGCLVGGIFACLRWPQHRLPAGLATGILCFALILFVSLLSGEGPEFNAAMFLELAGCVIGGGLAGLFTRNRKKGGKRVKR